MSVKVLVIYTKKVGRDSWETGTSTSKLKTINRITYTRY